LAYRVELTSRAARDLRDIAAWIHAAESVAAARWLDRLEDAILTLERFPKRCPVAPKSRNSTLRLRQLLFGRGTNVYRIIFEIVESTKQVYVLAIRHGARDAAEPEDLR
jgi:toxin ParE1/3/4